MPEEKKMTPESGVGNVVEVIGAPDNPISLMSHGYDLNNIPGKVKKRLVDSGVMKVEHLITPPNMPGEKLAKLRQEYKARWEEAEAKEDENASKPKDPIGEIGENPFKLEDIVEYKKQVCEIKGLDGDYVHIDRTNAKGELKRIKVKFWKVEGTKK